MSRRIKIGDSPDADLPGHVDSIITALRDGHRHLVFTTPNIPFDKTLDFDDPLIRAGGRFVRFDGGYLHGVNFSKSQVLGGPMVKAHQGSLNDMWHLIWDGIALQGNYDIVPETQHLLSMRWLDRSYFLNCAFRNGGAYGAVFGENGNASAVVFRRCEFTENQWHGCVLLNTRDYVFGDMCFFQRNQVAGLSGHSELLVDDQAGHVQNEYGFGLVQGCLFERDALGTGLLVGKARRLRVVGNRWVLSQIATQTSTQDSYFGWNSVNNRGSPLFANCVGTNIVREHNDIPGC